MGVALAQKFDVLLADQAPVHHPDAFGFAVFFFHDPHDVLHRGHVGAVAGKDFIGQRQPFRADHQPQADLLAIRAVVAAVTPRCLGVAQDLALKKRAGHIVKEELKADAKPTLVTLEQMLGDLLFAFVQLRPVRDRDGRH